MLMSNILSFESPWIFDSGTVRLPAPPAALCVDDIIEQLREDTLGQPYIFETSNERRLHFDRQAVQSVMDISRPNDLVLAYTQKMMSFLLFVPRPRSIFMVGLGGGSLAKFCHHYLRKASITVAEMDATIISLRNEFCVPPNGERFQVIHADGALQIAKERKSYDVILVDAFDSCGVAHSLASCDFYVTACDRLTSKGVMVMNLSGDKSRYTENINQIRRTFKGSILLMSVGGSENMVLFAFKQSVDIHSVHYSALAQALRRAFGLDFPLFLSRLTEAEVL